MNSTDWTVIETTEINFNATQLHHKETVFTLSNGYLGVRGSFEEGFPGACPATLINGIYDQAPLGSVELANAPDWLPLMIWIDADETHSSRQRFRLDEGTVVSYQRWLNLYQGTLSRRIRWRSPDGRTLDLHFERFVSLADEHILALRCHITPVDFTAPIEIHAGINGYANNEGLMHWDWLDQSSQSQSSQSQSSQSQSSQSHHIALRVRTRQSHQELGMAARLTLLGAEATITPLDLQGYPTLLARYAGQKQQSVTLEKVVTVFTSRDRLIGAPNPMQAAITHLLPLPNYAILHHHHTRAWEQVWQHCDVVIEGDSSAQLAVRYNLFQALSAAPRRDDRISIPAKTLSGFAYRGHVFWDTEIFILPLLTLTQPDLARNLLTYRYHTLAGARRKAKAMGYEGAMYAWESADTGDEVTPTWVPSCATNELIRIWCGDLELHINADIAYAIYQYWQATGDDAWMAEFGAEMVLDTATFWSSRVLWNAGGDRYEVLDVIGPDEYHDRVDNNAFTNSLVRWHLKTALAVWHWLQHTHATRAAELEQRLGLTGDRLSLWQAIIDKLWIATNPETGLIEQFDGFFQREDINLTDYEPRTRSMQAILGIEGANQRQVLKQPDVLMLLYLLREGALIAPEDQLDQRVLQANWDYYTPRTDHQYGSSLGPAIQAAIACRMGQPADAYEHFMRAALVDLTDVRGNAREGIHAASTGGIWQAIVFGFAGIHFTPQGPVAHPTLPPGWTRLKFCLQWQGQSIEFDLKAEAIPMAAPTLVSSSVPQSSLAYPVQGVIFDLDGVLTDTSEFHYLAWKRLADEEAIPFNRHLNETLRGVSRRDSLLKILNGRLVRDEQFQAMMDRKNGYYLELIKTITPDHLLPGALDLLRELRATGLRVAIGSSSKNAPDVVRRLGIEGWIDAIADGHSVTQSKPAPDVFLFAAAQLGLEPHTCVVVEDAEAGIEAALRAGMRAVGLGPQERVGAAHVVLPDLNGVRWSELVNSLTTPGRSLEAGLR